MYHSRNMLIMTERYVWQMQKNKKEHNKQNITANSKKMV